jgi:4a-hydroxytetrahydrobiopterin dehydratase
MSELASRKCVPCEGGVPPLKRGEITRLLKMLGNGWKAVKGHHLEKQFDFADFRQALGFANRVGAVAEEQGHHPDIHLAWGKVVLSIWTHKIDGLTESDFILAAKADQQLHGGGSKGPGRTVTPGQRQDQDDIRRAVEDGMKDLRMRKP